MHNTFDRIRDEQPMLVVNFTSSQPKRRGRNRKSTGERVVSSARDEMDTAGRINMQALVVFRHDVFSTRGGFEYHYPAVSDDPPRGPETTP